MSYTNPILTGFHPDPSIVRVNDTYYLACSTFEYFPGISLYESKDLVNWKYIGACVKDKNKLTKKAIEPSKGIWAPTIRYNEANNKFYVTASFCDEGVRNFVISAKDPKGDWSDPVWCEMDGIDPSLYFEEDSCYYCANDCGSRMNKTGIEGISIAKINPDTGKLLEKPVCIWHGTGGGFLEAPHIYTINGYYYLMVSEGGTNQNHMITVARAKNIYGPYQAYEDNPILTNRNDTSKEIACSGHGDLTRDADGNFWLVHLGTRPVRNFSQLGRETFLMPVIMKNGWPVIYEDKKSHLKIKTDLIANQKNFKPDEEFLEIGDGYKYVRQPNFDFEMEYTLNVGDSFRIYLNKEFYYEFILKNNKAVINRKVGDLATTESFDVSGNKFKISGDKENYYFYSFEINDWSLLKSYMARFLSPEIAGKCFTGVMIGIKN